MSVDEKTRDQKHLVDVFFQETALETVEKPYFARVAHKDTLDLKHLAAKTALLYPGASEEDIYYKAVQLFSTAKYLIADGYTINTDLVRISISVPGQYDAHDRQIARGKSPRLNITAAPQLRNYIAHNVELNFTGVSTAEGYIEQMIDAETGSINEDATAKGAMTVLGFGLKLMDDGTTAHASLVGAWFVEDATAAMRVQAKVIVNEPRRLVLVIPNLTAGDWWLELVSQANPKGSSKLMKELLITRSETTLHVTNDSGF
ncbi:hypothetical protein Barb4_03811 [Bacteroidales bacterium Barb4]|nr:hypothetical protein Barb4_03811 [Bacteroidales bacterium Barb4]